MRFSGALILFLSAITILPSAAEKKTGNANWPSFRGPNACGVADGYPLPAVWDVASSKNVRWTASIPGLGLSSPVIWGNRIFVSSAIGGAEKQRLKTGLYGDITSVQDDASHRWVVYCLDKKSGRILWETTVHSGVPRVKRHPKSTHANTTLATDGRHLVAFFGSEGLYCLNLDGKVLWSKDFGLLDSAFFVAPAAQWEFGSSPVIYKDRVLIQADVLKGSFVAALRIEDGSEIWRTARNDVPTWATPTVYANGQNAQMVVNGFKQIAGYDVATGRNLWWLQGGGDIPVPTPVVAFGMAFITNAHGRVSPIYAVRLDATGDISLKGEESSNQSVAWSAPRDGSYMATPVVYGDYLYNCRWNGVLGCYEARSGSRAYQERLGGGASAFTASPVAGDGKIYVTSEDGDVYVVKAGARFELIATNPLGEVCMASPAISQGVLYFRTQSRLVSISSVH